jgi:hypothetical protein
MNELLLPLFKTEMLILFSPAAFEEIGSEAANALRQAS